MEAWVVISYWDDAEGEYAALSKLEGVSMDQVVADDFVKQVEENKGDDDGFCYVESFKTNVI